MPTILVADDNSNIQKMVTLAFKGDGIDVVAVGNGEAAVKKAIEIVPDLVLADIFMPVRNGYEVCEFLKQDARFSHIPVVLLAGAFDPFDEREAQRVGADGVLKKPFVPPDPLVALVKELLAKNAERLVAVSVPAPFAAVPTQSASQGPVASPAPAFIPPLLVPPFVPPVSAPRIEESVENEIEARTPVVPVRDFSIPSAPPRSEPEGGADAFGSMLEPTPMEVEVPSVPDIGEPGPEYEVGQDREVEPASAHTAFEGFSSWRAGASTSEITEEEADVEHPNQFMPSNQDLMGRVWEVDPSHSDQSPDETVIEPLEALSQLTHSAIHVTTVRDDSRPGVESPNESHDIAQSNDVGEAAPASRSLGSDWPSTLAQAPEPATQVIESHEASMSPWRQVQSHAGTVQSDLIADVEAPAEPVTDVTFAGAPKPNAENSSIDDPRSSEYELQITQLAATIEAEPSTGSASHIVEDAEPSATEHKSDYPNQHAENYSHSEINRGADVNGESEAASADAETSDWIAALPESLDPQDTTLIASSVIAEMAPGAVASVANSFPVPTGTPADPRVVEDIVVRVVERMQPQILEIITREVLRPVVEALVRRQLEQKLPE